MSILEQLIRKRLENIRHNTDGGWQAACPICRAEGGDSTRSHLRIYRSGAFSCAKHQSNTPHNKSIRAFLYEGADAAALAALETSFIDPEPTKLDADKVYPEDMLTKLVPDHRYWMGRGISEDVLRRLEGGLAPKDERSKLSNRYIFPIRDHLTGRIIGFSGRLVDDSSFSPKHKHLVRVSRAVYPLWHNREAILKVRKVVLVEGQGDLLACMTAGIPYTLNLLGLHLNSRALGFLVSAGLDEIVISTNNDTLGKASSKEAGNKAADTLRAKLVPYLGERRVRVRLPQTRKDWCKTLEDNTGELEIFKSELKAVESV